MKKIISKLLIVTMVFSMLSSFAFGETITYPVLETDRVYEAEEMYYSTTHLKLTEDANAMGGWMLKTIKHEKPSADSVQGTANDVEDSVVGYGFKVNVPVEVTGVSLRFRYTINNGTNTGIFVKHNNNNWKGGYPTTSVGEYKTYALTGFTLSKGENTFKFLTRNANLIIDQIEVVAGLAKEYAAPSVTSGTVTYPKAISMDKIGTVPKFEDKDNVLFIGDSITHFANSSGKYHNNLFSYYSTRYPDKEISYLNKGIGGNVVSEVLNRMEYDIFNEADAPANKAVVLIGTNDLAMDNYYKSAPQISGDIAKKEHNFKVYENGLRKIVEKLKEKGIKEIILISPPLYDEWSTGINSAEVAEGFNNAVRRGATIQNKIAKEFDDVYFIDINTPMYIIDNYNKEVKGSDFNLFGSAKDRVHPSAVASWIMTYAILKAQGETGEVATVKIDAENNLSSASNATVSELNAATNLVSYKYSPKAIPLAADSAYRDAEKLFPITEELNREIIQVSGLEDGIYDIKIDGNVVMSADKAQLEKGINIADKENNPGQKQALKALIYTSLRADQEKLYRDYHLDIENNVSKYKLDRTSNDAMLSSLKTYVDGNPTVTKAAEIYEKMQNEKATADSLQELSKGARSISNPRTYTVSIEKSENQSTEGTVNTKYVEHQLPVSARLVQEQKVAPGISVDKVKFTDAAGNELKQIPTSGTVYISGTLTNNSTDKIQPMIWSGSYLNNKPIDIGLNNIEIKPGTSYNISGTVSVEEGADTLKTGFWGNLGTLNAYLPTAVYPSNENGIYKVFVNNEELDFDENQTSYEWQIASGETVEPFVSVIPKNLNSDIQIMQGVDEAKIFAGDDIYVIKFKKISTPHLSSITVDGVAIENFSKEGYYYELPKENLGEVEAVAADDVDVSVVQADSENSNTATITTENSLGKSKVYTVKFVTRDVGEIQNVKFNGAESQTVYGIPSVGAKLENFYDPYLTPEQIFSKLVSDSELDNDAYRLSNNSYRKLSTIWETVQSGAYGYNLAFTVADVGGSMFVNENVTRLLKLESDFKSGMDTTKAYEFTLSKPATVYISTAGESSYIEGLNKGWTYEYDPAKYSVPTPSYIEMQYSADTKLYVPDGGINITTISPMRGHVYYKHFNADETVEIPCFSATASNKQTVIFVVWDEKQ